MGMIWNRMVLSSMRSGQQPRSRRPHVPVLEWRFVQEYTFVSPPEKCIAKSVLKFAVPNAARIHNISSSREAKHPPTGTPSCYQQQGNRYFIGADTTMPARGMSLNSWRAAKTAESTRGLDRILADGLSKFHDHQFWEQRGLADQG